MNTTAAPTFAPGVDIEALRAAGTRTMARAEFTGPTDIGATLAFVGDPTGSQWMVTEVTPETVTIERYRTALLRPALLGCVIPGCRGHVEEEADTFEQLTHTGADVDLMDRPPVEDERMRAIFRAAPIIDDRGAFVYVEADIDREVPVDDVERFALALEEAARRLRTVATAAILTATTVVP